MRRHPVPWAIALAAVLAGCAPKEAPVRGAEASRFLMGTLCSVLVPGNDTAADRLAAQQALDEIARLEQVMSSWREDSELSGLNRSAGGETACSDELFAVLDSALAYAEETRGAFDPTVEPLLRAWDIRGAGRVPSDAELAEARAHVGWRRFRLDRARRVARLEPGAAVDLGGIGKGFALDLAARKLVGAGTDRALLDFGGEVLALGNPPRGQAGWEVPIAHPANRTSALVAVFARDQAVSTTGQSERGFEANGRRYGHVLDPTSGRPVESRGSVTVVAASATRADAISTALFVAGPAAAGEWAQRHPTDGVIWLEPATDAVRMWSWNVAPRPLPGQRVIRMTRPGRDAGRHPNPTEDSR